MIGILLRILFFPLRLLLFSWYRLRNPFPGGDVVFHQMPDRFVAQQPRGLLARFLPRQETAFVDYLALLEALSRSDRLKRFVYSVPDLGAMSWTEAARVAEALGKLRESGVELISYCESGNLRTLYCAARADHRLARPFSSYILQLPSLDSFFLKDALGKFGVQIETYAAGRHKAEGMENLTRQSFSPEARKTLGAMLDSMRNELRAGFAQTPELEEKTARDIWKRIEQNVHLDAEDLAELGFFGHLVPRERFEEYVLTGRTPEEQEELRRAEADALREAAGLQTPAKESASENADHASAPAAQQVEEVRAHTQLSPAELRRRFKADARAMRRRTSEAALYKRLRRERYSAFRFRSAPQLAFVTLQGPILMGRPGGEAGPYGIQALPLRDLFRNLENSREEAVFLYIDSPGGSADASELLYQSIYELSWKKPVFAVLGDVAASGGFYLACAANRIYGARLSIVGSIGVIQIRPNLTKLYKKYGVGRDAVRKDPTRELLAEHGALTPAGKKLSKKLLERSYDLFLDRVARGRDRERKDVEPYAEGRIFSGEQFMQAGLLDGDASLIEAVRIYARELGYPEDQEFRVQRYPEIKADLRSLLGGGLPFTGSWSAASLLREAFRRGESLTAPALDAGFRTGEPLYLAPALLDEISRG